MKDRVTMRVRCPDEKCPVTVQVVQVEKQSSVIFAPARFVCVKCLGEMKVVSGPLRRAMNGG